MNAIWRRGLIAPLVLAVLALLAWPLAGAATALAVLGFAPCDFAWHLFQLDALARQRRAARGAGSRGRGIWASSTALYHRVRLRSARQRDPGSR
jgi:hypothetical protein